MSVSCHEQKSSTLLNHPVGTGKKGGWNSKANCLRGFEIDDELKFGWLFDRKL
jgi:hypothetical protein